MKRFSRTMLAGVLMVGGGAAMAANDSLNEFRDRVLPVLVHVNARGGITEVSPSSHLTPQMSRLLRQNLDEMVAKPATEHGRPISSQVIINLALEATPRNEGDYLARFVYVSSSPVPTGSWYWVHIDGHRLALANRNDVGGRERFPSDNRNGYLGDHFDSYSHEPSTPVQETSRSTPTPAPKPGH
jgi:hypothetical protein